MKTRQIVCWLLCAASPALAQVSPWSSGTYAYDGTGNVKAIGADYYVYDQAGRLIRGSADKERSGVDNYQAYTYDAFGNRLTASTTGTQCVSGCGVNVQVNNANRVTDHGATYDAAGNLKHFDTNYYTYDGAGMLVTVSSSPTAADAEYIYTAGDQRLAVYTGGGNWRFTIRDLDAKVVREVTAFQSGGTTTWTWHRDHIFRNGLLLATVLPEGTQHYHLDHLGTPRLVTDGTGRKLGVHAYYPFGDELSLGLGEPTSPERLKFTGHERDDESNGTSLDYMHARSYEIRAGRLLSVDPVLGNLLRPGSWNRYAYVLNNPMNYTDPTGMADDNNILTCSGPGGGIPCVHAQVTVSAKDPGILSALFYRIALKLTLRSMGREFTNAEIAAMDGHNYLASYYMLGGQPPPRLMIGIVMIGSLDGAAAEELPALQRIHPASTYATDPEAASSLEYWRTRPTQEIIDSLKPGQDESLTTWPDGRMANGNTRTLVLEERGVPINSLPRDVLVRP